MPLQSGRSPRHARRSATSRCRTAARLVAGCGCSCGYWLSRFLLRLRRRGLLLLLLLLRLWLRGLCDGRLDKRTLGTTRSCGRSALVAAKTGAVTHARVLVL
jgi:hypothetical protein